MREDTIQQAESFHEILDAVVSVNSRIPDDALTADLLGTEREGHGVVIRDDGLILTIGYLIADAETIWIGIDDDTAVPAYSIAVDYDSGLGLIKPAMPVDLPSIKLDSAATLEVEEPVFVAGSGGIGETIEARVIGKQQFTGRWEYLLEEAIYTAPAHTAWAGAALLNGRGRLCGIGSLLVQTFNTDTAANMFVPVDTVAPHLDDLCRYGRRNAAARPWLGLLIQDDEQLEVAAVHDGCPGEKAGIRPGDILIAVEGNEVHDLAEFYRRLWSCGAAGVRVSLTVERDGKEFDVKVATSERNAFIKKDTIN